MSVARVWASVRRAERFMRCDLWTQQLYLRWNKPSQRFLLHVLRNVYLIVRGVFFRDQIRLHAAALTYVSLLSLIPLMAVVFSLFTAFGGLEDAKKQLQGFLIDLLAVSQREKILTWLEETLGTVNAGTIGGISTLFLFLTAVTLLGNIERAFNAIWGVKEDRSFFKRFQRYWPVLTLGPPLMGVSLSFTASVQTSPTVARILDTFPGLASLISLGSIVFTIAGFTIAYTVMPNTKVKISAALMGGLAGGLLFEIAKRAYAIYAKQAITYSAIYGSLAFVPLTILWVYVSWLLVLTGAMIAFAFQNARTFEPEQVGAGKPARERERIAAVLLLAVHQRFAKGRGATPEEALVARIPGTPRAVREALTELVEKGLLLLAEEQAKGDTPHYLPGKPATKTTLADVHRLLHGDPDAPLPPDREEKRSPPNAAIRELDAAERAALERLEAITLADLLDADASLPPEGR